jgi:hypothetical protein
MEALVSGRPSEAATASASGRLLLQATIFMTRRTPSPRDPSAADAPPFRTAGRKYQGDETV